MNEHWRRVCGCLCFFSHFVRSRGSEVSWQSGKKKKEKSQKKVQKKKRREMKILNLEMKVKVKVKSKNKREAYKSAIRTNVRKKKTEK